MPSSPTTRATLPSGLKNTCISTGIADESRWGPEFEFYIFDSVSYEYGVNRASYRVECQEADWTSVQSGHGHYIPAAWRLPCHPAQGPILQPAHRDDLHLQAMGVPVKYHHHEVGGPGQSEIETPMMGLLQAGDATMIIKYVTKMTAHAHGQDRHLHAQAAVWRGGLGDALPPAPVQRRGECVL